MGSFQGALAKDEILHKLNEELKQREKLIEEMNKSWEEKLKEAQAIQQERKAALQVINII